jgi:glycosyltransferase involved in cell wall biosynthesis
VGRLVQQQKRVLDFVPLIRELKQRNVSFMLHLIGDGSDRSRLEQELKENGLADDVKLWGWLTPSEVAAQLADSDAFVLLSDYEGLPVALLEAMASTLVPVVTRINSGNSQLIRQANNGLMFEVGDAIACAEHLAQLATDQELLHRLRSAAWETAREYSVERMVENYERCFQEVTASDFMNANRETAPRPYPLLPACRSRYPFWLRKVKSRLATLRSMPSVGQQSR